MVEEHPSAALLGAWAAGALEGATLWRLERHVADCPSCAQRLATEAAAEVELRALWPAIEPPLAPVVPLHPRPARRSASPVAATESPSPRRPRAPAAQPRWTRFGAPAAAVALAALVAVAAPEAARAPSATRALATRAAPSDPPLFSSMASGCLSLSPSIDRLWANRSSDGGACAPSGVHPACSYSEGLCAFADARSVDPH
jgi:hypothetical protein